MPSKGIGPTALGHKLSGEVSPRRKAGARKQHDWMDALAAAVVPNRIPQPSLTVPSLTRIESSSSNAGAAPSLVTLVGRAHPTPALVAKSPGAAPTAPAPHPIPASDAPAATATAPHEPTDASHFVPVRGIEVARLPVEAVQSFVVREMPVPSLRPSASPAPAPVATPTAPHAAPRTAFPFIARAPQDALKAEIPAVPLGKTEPPAEPSSPEPVVEKPAAEGPARRLPFVMDAPRADAHADAPRLDAPVVRAYAEHRAATQADAKQPVLPETAPRPVEAKTQSGATPEREPGTGRQQREDPSPSREIASSREVARPSAAAETTAAPTVRGVSQSQPAAPTSETVAPRDLLPLPHEALAQAILSRARALPQNGALELRFALEPVDLGAVQVRIETRGRQVRIEIETATHAAASVLTPGIAKLTAELHSAGYHDPQVSVGTDAKGGDASSETGQRETSPQGKRRGGTQEGATYKREKGDGRLDRTA